MCSELFRIPIQVGGVPLFGVGILLGLWVAFGTWAVWRTACESNWTSAIGAQLPTLFLGALLLFFLPRFFSEGIPIRGYGLMVLCGSVAGVGMAASRAQKVGLHQETIMSLAVWMFGGGILGARLFYVIEYWGPRIRKLDLQGNVDWPATLKSALSYTEGGLVVYGAFFGAIGAFAIFVRRRCLPGLALADLIAPSLLAGLAFGRIGCLLNGCCYGGPTDAPWAITFPRFNAPNTWSMPYQEQAEQGLYYGFQLAAESSESRRPRIENVRADSAASAAGVAQGMVLHSVNNSRTPTLADAQNAIFAVMEQGRPLRLETLQRQVVELPALTPPLRSFPVHPTQIYSAINAALLAWVLWSFYPIRRRDGEVFALMLLAYPVARFILEIIRVDEAAVFSTRMSISQNISIITFAIACWLWRRLAKLPPKRTSFA